jgi:adenosylmethionine-8-amino-7-oxononanoate aminotransferase
MTNNWYELGKNHIWHPYTQMKTAPTPINAIATEGVIIKLDDGRELIDGISSWWSVCHGYNHPHIMQAIGQQAAKMPHIMFAGIAHEPAYVLANKIVNITPEGLNKVFFSDSGSVSVEVAMKMAIQYWRHKGKKDKSKFLSFNDGYHGDTMGAMSLASPDDSMHKDFSNYIPRQYVVDLPRGEYSFADFDQLLGDIKHHVAGVIIEPLLQGAGGMVFHSADILAEIYRITKKHDLLFIADEIATGLGRTGRMFACNDADITPDIMCISKALTGGTLPLAATIATDEIYNEFLSDDLFKAFMHGPTFMANPLACAAAIASLELFEQEPRLQQVATIEQQMWEGLSDLSSLSITKNVRVMGAVGVVQVDVTWEDMWNFRKQFLELGVWLRPFGDVIYLMPSFTISTDELSKLIFSIKKVIKSR